MSHTVSVSIRNTPLGKARAAHSTWSRTTATGRPTGMEATARWPVTSWTSGGHASTRARLSTTTRRRARRCPRSRWASPPVSAPWGPKPRHPLSARAYGSGRARKTRVAATAVTPDPSALGSDEVLVTDRGFPLAQLHAAGITRYVSRGPTNFTARRAALPAYGGKGRRPT
jgi:hypothetical protein